MLTFLCVDVLWVLKKRKSFLNFSLVKNFCGYKIAQDSDEKFYGYKYYLFEKKSVYKYYLFEKKSGYKYYFVKFKSGYKYVNVKKFFWYKCYYTTAGIVLRKDM